MKHYTYKLVAVIVLLSAFSFVKVTAKEIVVPKMYMFAFAASFTDTIVHFTNVMEVDSAWIQSKGKYLIGCDSYSRQFRDFLAEKKQMPQRTCVVFSNKSRKKLEKKYLKMKRLYTQSKDGAQHFDVRFLDDNEFSFKVIDINVYIQAEQERIAQEKEQEALEKEQKILAKKQKREARKRKKEAKKNKKK